MNGADGRNEEWQRTEETDLTKLIYTTVRGHTGAT